MAKRRTLVTGIKSKTKSDPKKEAAFVYGQRKPAAEEKIAKAKVKIPPPQPEPVEQPTVPPQGRAPLTTRLRADLSAALKRASLERQLAGLTPNTVQDIIEVALEPWLRDNGHLK